MDSRILMKIYHANPIFWSICALLLVANMAVYFLYVRNGSAEISRLQEAYRSQRTEMAAWSKKQTEARRLTESIEAVEGFWGAIGPKDHFPDQVRKLKRLTESRQLTVERIAFSPQRLEKMGLWRYETVVSARGEYGQLKGLLADIQNLEGLFCIEAFSMLREKPDAPVSMKAKVILYLTEKGPEP